MGLGVALALGHAQMWLSIAALWTLVTLGLEPVTWGLVGAATIATLISRIL